MFCSLLQVLIFNLQRLFKISLTHFQDENQCFTSLSVIESIGLKMGVQDWSVMAISTQQKWKQTVAFVPSSLPGIRSSSMCSLWRRQDLNPISNPRCPQLVGNFKSQRGSFFFLWRNMLNTCFLELVIKTGHAVINSFKNVTGSNPHQGREKQTAFHFSGLLD